MNNPNGFPSSIEDTVCPSSPPSIPSIISQIDTGGTSSRSTNLTVPSNESNQIMDRDAFKNCMKLALDRDPRPSNAPHATYPDNDERRSGELTSRVSTRFNDPDDPIITNTNRTPGMLPVGSRSSRVPDLSTERSNPVGSSWTPTNITEFARHKHLVEDVIPQQCLQDFLFVPQLEADMHNLAEYVVKAKPRTFKDLDQELTAERPNCAGKIVYTGIASGTFGRVFRFTHPCRTGSLAVKIRIRPDPRLEPSLDVNSWNQEWKTEQRILNRLAASRPHPNLVNGYQFDFWAQGVGLTIFDYHPGNLLGMKSLECPDDDVKIRLYAAVAGEIASGLNHLHLLNIIHRDMKPGNVLIGWDERTIARGNCIKQIPGDGVFTPGFTAPETMFAGMGGYATYTEASDFWSLGVTIYSLITDHKLDVSKDLTHAELNLDGGCCMAVAMKQHGCPDAVCGLVLKLCQLEPQDRMPGTEIVPLTETLITYARGIPGHGAPFTILHQGMEYQIKWNGLYGTSGPSYGTPVA
ncbi:Protein kinase [Mycena sanguinolenta]|uniref:Protein kinase n=1 Tax=Mycena sanguinolenta TaxID=230812 RepID=A0A8H6U0Y9_9AGAR|nr:Protein kinase [Mycena sanguinolenta]